MNYIRTKDGRILKFNDKICNPLPCVIGEVIDDNVGIFKGVEVIKQSDNIEELCDEFVLGETKYYKPRVAKLPLDFLRECVKTKTLYDLVVYGSIWVNDELRKVAKMNGKGDLELL